MKIEKGQKYLCTEDTCFVHKLSFIKGKIYTASRDEQCIMNRDGDYISIINHNIKNFQPLSSAKWAIKRTPENSDVVNRWTNEKRMTVYDEGQMDVWFHSDRSGHLKQKDGYTEIDFETFKEITGMREEKGKPLLGEKEAVHCPTLELAEKVIEILKRQGAKPKNNTSLYWEHYRGQLCFVLDNYNFGFSDCMFYESNNYTIIPAEQFIKDNEQKQSEKEVPKFQKGDTVVIRQCSKDTYWYADKIGKVFVLEAEKPSDNWFIKGSTCLSLNPYDIQKIFTIEDVRNGKCAIENDGTEQQLNRILNYGYGNRTGIVSGHAKYYFNCEILNSWSCDNTTDLPTQSVKLFLSQIEGEKEQPENVYRQIGNGQYYEIPKSSIGTEIEEWQPKWGEEVEVSLGGNSWHKRVFIGINPRECSDCRYVVTDMGNGSITIWRDCRKPLEIHTFTTEQAKQDLAKLHNLNVNQVKITE